MTGLSQEHWQKIYSEKDETDVSWYEPRPEMSLRLIEQAGIAPGAAAVDIGAGASYLTQNLLERGFGHVTALDLSAEALAIAKTRLPATAPVDWVAADVRDWQPSRRYQLWHDRAAFHFLILPEDRAAYVATMARALTPGGFAVIATFALDGPERCSGLPVQRYDGPGILAALGVEYRLIESRQHRHRTGGGSIQNFQFALLQRRR